MGGLGDSTTRIPLQLTRQLDQLCDEYESLLIADGLAELAPFLEKIGPDGREPLLRELLALAADHLRQQGTLNCAEAIASKNPTLKKEVDAYFSQQQDHSATEIYEKAPTDAAPPLLSPRRKRSRGLHIRCPHCSNHVEVIGDTALESVDCTVCGSNFSLTDRANETRLAEVLQKIDRFEVISRLGVGGFGTVWKARDTDLDRTVAIKIPRHGQLSEEELEGFFREARSVAQLRHPNIVPVHEIGKEGDAVFIVSDLIRGVSLTDRLTGSSFTTRETAQLCVTIVDALEHAHKRGVVHRDLKPSNVMLDDSGDPHLMDFGLAKREAEEVTMTTDGQVIGTPAYMSPEQAQGKSAWVDRRADIYSFGVILFEMLTGELPFRGNAQMQVHQRMTEEAPNVHRLSRHIPLDLATICAKCLEREPGRRYQTAEEVGEELKRFLDNLPIKARPLSPPERLIRWVTRWPLRAALVGLVLFLAIAGPAVAIELERRRSRLDALVQEKDNLISQREKEKREAISRSTGLQAKLDLWEGKANPWALWPPREGESPKVLQLYSLLKSRYEQLSRGAAGESKHAKAQRLLALATIHEAQEGHRDQAIASLREASDELKALHTGYPNELSYRLALADCYERLSTLEPMSEFSQSKEWLAAALKVRRELAASFQADALVQAQHIETAMRSYATAGFDNAPKELKAVTEQERRLSGLWPTDTAELYRIACILAGRAPVLGESTPARDLPD